VLIVNALVAVAVTVPDPPKLIDVPLTVKELLFSAELGRAVIVFVAPLIDLLVKVAVLDAVNASVIPYPESVVGVPVMEVHAGATVALEALVN
jgi:hypothetical protein